MLISNICYYIQYTKFESSVPEVRQALRQAETPFEEVTLVKLPFLTVPLDEVLEDSEQVDGALVLGGETVVE